MSAPSPQLTGVPAEIVERLDEFTGRAWVLSALDGWVADGSRRFVLSGGPGSGKSTLSAHVVQQHLAGSERAVESSLGAWHFCQEPDSQSWLPDSVVTRLAEQLATGLDGFKEALAESTTESHAPSIHLGNVSGSVATGSIGPGAVVTGVNVSIIMQESDPERRVDVLLRRPLRRLAAAGRLPRLAVLVDALDEALPHAAGVELVDVLARMSGPEGGLPPQIGFVFTTRPDPRIVVRFGRASLDLVADSPPNIDDARVYAERKLSVLTVGEPGRELAARIAQAGAGNFLYARYVLEEVLADSDWLARGLDPGSSLPEGLDGHYKQFLRREIGGAGSATWATHYRRLLGLLTVAHGTGLTAQQMADVTGLRRSEADDALRTMTQYLKGSHPDGPLQLYHQSLRDFFRSPGDYHTYPHEADWDLADFFIRTYGDDWPGCEDAYAVEYTPTHLLAALGAPGDRRISTHAAEALRTLLVDVRYLETRVAATGIDAVLADLRAGHEAIPEDRGIREMFRVLDLQAHDLRSWTPEPFPQLFAQQVLERASVVGAREALTAARSRLEELRRPYLAARWRTAEESASLLRTIRHGSGWVLGGGGCGSAAVVATGSSDGTVQVWEVESGRLRQSLAGDGQAISSVAATPDGSLVLAGRADGTLLAWDVISGVGRRFAQAHRREVTSLCLLSDGRRALSASADSTLGLWDVETRTLMRTLTGSGGEVRGVAVTSDGRRAVSISADKTVRFWDVDSGAEQAVMHGHQDLVLSVCVLPGDRHAVSGSWDGQMRGWELHADGTVTAAARIAANLDTNGGPVWGLAPTSATTVVAARDDGMVEIWDLERGVPSGLLSGHRSAARAVTVSADGRRAVSAAEDETLKVWDLTVPAELEILRGHEIEVTSTAVSADGGLALSSSRTFGRVKAWNVREGRQIWEHSRKEEYKGVAIIEPWSRLLLCGRGPHSSAFVLETHSLATREETDQIVLSYGSVAWIRGDWILAVQTEYEKREHAGTAENELDVLLGVGAVRKGRERLVYRVLDSSSAEVVHTLSVDPVSGWPSAAAITPDCRRVVAISSPKGNSIGTVLWWDTLTGEVWTTAGPESGHVFGMAVTADGCYAAAGLSDGSIDVWDLDDGSKRTVAPDVGQIAGLAPLDGRRIVSISTDGVLIVWDITVPRQLARTFVGHSLSSVAVTSNGSTIFVGDNWGNVHAYSLITPSHPVYPSNSS